MNIKDHSVNMAHIRNIRRCAAAFACLSLGVLAGPVVLAPGAAATPPSLFAPFPAPNVDFVGFGNGSGLGMSQWGEHDRPGEDAKYKHPECSGTAPDVADVRHVNAVVFDVHDLAPWAMLVTWAAAGGEHAPVLPTAAVSAVSSQTCSTCSIACAKGSLAPSEVNERVHVTPRAHKTRRAACDRSSTALDHGRHKYG